jgi:peptidoglycan hydrolase-like protein with peptidoglycan-binding domain
VRRGIVASCVVVGVTGVGAVALTARGTATGPTDGSTDDTDINTAEAIETDLVDETEYDGTLGHLTDDPVTALGDGTVTSTPSVGDTLGGGSVLYSVDGDPVIGLIGETPAYRDLTAFAEPDEVSATTDGVVTGLPTEGQTLSVGDVAYTVDGEPVIVLVGSVPAYRSLADLPDNMEGDDVLQLEQNLALLGLAGEHGVEVDGEFTSATADAVEAVQEAVGMDDDGSLDLGEFVVIDAPTTVVDVAAEVGDTVSPASDPLYTVGAGARLSGPDVQQLNDALVELGDLAAEEHPGAEFGAATEAAVRALQTESGMEVDGALELGEVRFLDAPVRVTAIAAPAGTSLTPGTTVLEVTGEETVVTFDLPAADQGVVEVGQDVDVELPDGTLLAGTVTAVASVATVSDDAPVFAVEVELADPTAAEGLDEAPVDVAVVTASVEGVVAVPVTALVALREGGYAVEVVRDGVPELVAVEAGFFADGFVEVRGEIAAGDEVVVP